MIVDAREDLPAPALMALVEHTTKEGRMPNSGVWVLRAGEDAQRFLVRFELPRSRMAVIAAA